MENKKMTQLKFQTLFFNELSIQKLYNILQLRSEVFVVEQNCVYQDIDFKDNKALHILGFLNSELVAYCRLFKPNDYFIEASIGRVIVKQKYRQYKFGHALLKEAIWAVENKFETNKITISAQLYLQKFYESHGFITTSEVYLEDDIEHIEMKKGV